MSFESLPAGWEVWNDEPARVVLAYRPDVFDGADFPAPCMPTIYLSKGQRGRRPGQHDPAPDAAWYVTLYLEPEIEADPDVVDTRAEAEAAATDVAREFATGQVDYRALYQVPRPDYFDRLDDLTGRE